MRYIELSKEKKRQLRKKFKVSNVTVWSALTYQTRSPLADRIREAARKSGGVEKRRLSVPADFMPNCETEYLRENGRLTGIVQSFENGVTVSFDGLSGNAELRYAGRTVKTYCHVTMKQWAQIVFEAQSMSEATAGV